MKCNNANSRILFYRHDWSGRFLVITFLPHIQSPSAIFLFPVFCSPSSSHRCFNASFLYFLSVFGPFSIEFPRRGTQQRRWRITQHLPSRWCTWSTRVPRVAKHTGLGKAKAPESSRRQPSSAPSLTRNRRIQFCPLASSSYTAVIFDILGMLSFPPSLFDSHGIWRISWLNRKKALCVFPRRFRKFRRDPHESLRREKTRRWSPNCTRDIYF